MYNRLDEHIECGDKIKVVYFKKAPYEQNLTIKRLPSEGAEFFVCSRYDGTTILVGDFTKMEMAF